MAESLIQQLVRKHGPEAVLAALTPEQRTQLKYEWRAFARPEQLPPAGTWRTWLVKAGRGFGKTRLGAEWVRSLAESNPQARIALVAPTAADARDVMVEGESGIMAICPPWNRPLYESSKRRITWANGAMAITYSAEEADRLRGPQHSQAWCDEIATWEKPDEMWDMLMFGLRLGVTPQALVTTTPRPIPILRRLIKSTSTVVVGGSTYDNSANLPADFIAAIKDRYEGSRLGRQEIHAEVLDDTPGALWMRKMFDVEGFYRPAPPLIRKVIAVDPAVSVNAESDNTGIVIAGIGEDGRGYVIADESGKYTPQEWGSRVIRLYHEHECSRCIVEVNQGGDLVEANLRTNVGGQNIAITRIHAKTGKVSRAEPVAALYEQNKISHVKPMSAMEDEMCTWCPGETKKSPDRVDALTYAMTDLMLGAHVSFGGEAGEGSRRSAVATPVALEDDDDWEDQRSQRGGRR